MDNKLSNYEYNNYSKYLDVEDKIKYLKTVKANFLITSYIKSLISNLYIEIPNIKRGYINEMIKDNSLVDYGYETTTSIIPFLRDDSEIIRGLLIDDFSNKVKHSFIKFNLNEKEYIFDPLLNIIVPKESYYGIFLPKELGKVSALKVKTDLLDTLINGKKTSDGFRIINSTNDINSSFYKTNMLVSGTNINKKILMLTTRFK